MRTKLIILLIFISVASFATTRYWVGGGSSANWNATSPTNWSATSGGAGDASVPSSSAAYDSVYFDGVGANAQSNCTVSATAYCQILVTTGYTGTISGAQYIRVYGLTLTIASTTTFTSQLYFFATTGTVLISTGGNTGISHVTIGTTGSSAIYKLSDNLTQGSAGITTLQNGTLDLNGKTLKCGSFSSSNTNTRDVTSSVAGGKIEIIGVGATPFTVASGTFEANNVQNWSIKVSAGRAVTGTATYAFGGETYGSIDFAPVYASYDTIKTITISGDNTFSEFKITTPRKFLFTDGTTQTVSSFIATGTASSFIKLRGTSTGGWTLSCASGNICCDYLKISYSTASGGATFKAGINSVDNGGNSGWSFTNCLTSSSSPYYQICY